MHSDHDATQKLLQPTTSGVHGATGDSLDGVDGQSGPEHLTAEDIMTARDAKEKPCGIVRESGPDGMSGGGATQGRESSSDQQRDK